MAGTRRERELARARYQRQRSRRAAAAARARRRRTVVAAAFAVLAVLAGVFTLVRLDRDGTAAPSGAVPAAATPAGSATPSVSRPPTATPSRAVAACAFPRAGTAAKDVGVPAYDTATARRPFTATLVTNRGEVTFVALADRAPCTTTSFRHLAAEKFFDGTTCHRVTAALLQCGDPTGSGSGGPGYSVALENPPAGTRYPAGTIAMARTEDPDSNGSQFFVVYDDVTLPAYGGGGYSVFGRVTSGLDVVRGVGAAGAEPPGDGRPKTPLTIQSVRIAPGARS